MLEDRKGEPSEMNCCEDHVTMQLEDGPGSEGWLRLFCCFVRAGDSTPGSARKTSLVTSW